MFHLNVPIEVIHVLIAAIIGLVIGIERAIKQKVASIKTFSFLCAGCSIFCIVSQVSLAVDPTRIAANILTGLGFIGAGVIFKHGDKIEGVTTAVIIWFVAGLGMSCGFGNISFALWCTGLYFFILFAGKLGHVILDLVHKGEY